MHELNGFEQQEYDEDEEQDHANNEGMPIEERDSYKFKNGAIYKG